MARKGFRLCHVADADRHHCLETLRLLLAPLAARPWPLSTYLPRYTIRSGLLEAEGLKPSYAPQRADGPTAIEQVRTGTAHVSQLAVAASFAELETSGRTDLVHFAQINVA